MVTTQTTSVQKPLYMLTAIGLALSLRAIHLAWAGLNFAGNESLLNVAGVDLHARASTPPARASAPNLVVSLSAAKITSGARTRTFSSGRSPFAARTGSVTSAPWIVMSPDQTGAFSPC